MPDKSWKRAERRVASLLHGERTGATGEATPDVVSDWLAVEVKYRRRLPSWLKDALSQARVNASAGKLPIVVLREKGDRGGWVLLGLGDFCDWFGDIEHE